MSLLIFSYILALFLFFFSYYLDSKVVNNNSVVTGLSMVSALVALLAGVSAHLMFAGYLTVSTLVFKGCLAAYSLVVLSILRLTVLIPYNTKSGFLRGLSTVFFLFAIFLIFTTVERLYWVDSFGFAVHSTPFFGLIDGFSLYVALFMIGIPALSVCILLIRALALKSRIYRQRLFFVALSICTGFSISYLLYVLSLSIFWVFPLVPFGLAVFIVLLYQSISLTTLYDRSLTIASLLNLLVFGLIFSSVAAVLTTLALHYIKIEPLVFTLLVGLVIFFLFLREKAEKKMKKYSRVGLEYEAELEAGFESLDFTVGGDEVISKTVSLLEEFIECSSSEILIADEKGKLSTVFSSYGSKNEIAAGNKAINFLLSHNDSVILKTQAVTNHVYQDIKNELLRIFELGRSDALILLREGHHIVGVILLGAKKRGGDYTDYDAMALSKLYSNFFLVMYYLKNIANEAVVLTIDREIEFSGQIITSIQDNIDRIDHPKVDVDFITKSARKLGGDFIDFINLGEEKYLFVMGDVSGKGLNASMSMVILKSVLRTFLSETGDFKKLIVKVNSFVKNNLPKGTFFAGVFGLMDFTTNTLYYINCGVPAMFLYTASYNNAIEIQGEGKVLGFVRDITKYLKVKKIVLNPSDVLLMTTDGLVDSTNLRGERFGKDRVQRMLVDNRSYPSGRIAQFLCENLSSFVSRELDDDITVLVFKYLNK